MKTKLLTLLLAAILLVTGCGKEEAAKPDSAKQEATSTAKESKLKIDTVTIKKVDSKNFYVATTAEGNQLSYAYYVYKDNKILKRFPYKKDAHFEYKVTKPGTYKVKVFIKDSSNKKVSKYTKDIKM
ncbi:triple tyrosine motif-containing protein [Neobacillus sp. PS2-9]|uniref:triple tyrosine motif-containing protein n=1 Tax=Neobacillus sp. PS2-9 TaxID=3070676 RepID=UPI0027DEE84C|nr:triple tyrosine motif-containing protein [Neobacillus sp. PS2-9]WML58606.1 triple tyrosine motif-containing protein [Neobacillus sp. PS2-9]